LRVTLTGEKCIACGETLEVFKAIELGHIFKLGTKYSEALGATFLDESGKENPIIMGSYGIGVERLMACYMEQNHDENGIIWQSNLAPYDIQLLGLNLKKENVKEESDKIYGALIAEGYEVLYDDRIDAQAGFKFKDADLLGMPVQIVVGEKGLKDNSVEIKIRKSGERFKVKLDDLSAKVKELFPQK